TPAAISAFLRRRTGCRRCVTSSPRRPTWKGFTMTKRSLQYLLKLSVLTSAALLALSARADLQERNEDRQERNDDRDHDDDRREHHDLVRLATGQYVTPTIIDDAVQQYLNPGLAAYPNFIAG